MELVLSLLPMGNPAFRFVKTIFLLFLYGLTLLSCNRIKRKGHAIIDSATVVVKEKKNLVVEKIFPHFDADTPDTKYNQQRFLEFFEFAPTTDVKKLYCYADRMGIDASYWFSFICADSTVEKIKNKLQLKWDQQFSVVRNMEGKIIDTMYYKSNYLQGGLNSSPTRWWDTAFINNHTAYGKVQGHINSYLWHDSKKKKVYFFSFDL
ncbi:hypothetical protein [Ferruginibacter sp. SUN106]|uniref:hypothetical protein n=1 Tax=Ferruginibacter sp. SUN106 TaxID=2978348 RepID=UPI003D36BA24